MKVKFYGTRGSIPVCEPEFQQFGGNTTCLLVTCANDIGILDAGSGIRRLGKDLVDGTCPNDDHIYIGFTHFHWDHIQGLPYFLPAYDPKRKFTLSVIGKERASKDLKSVFATQMAEEYFPVPFEKMGANFEIQQSDEDVFTGATGFHVTVSKHSHPGGAFGYRIQDTDGTVLVFCTDVEHVDGIDPNVVKLAQGADLLIHDGQYTSEELKSRKGWGHSSWEQAVEVAKQAGAKQLAITHHDPDHNDEFLLAQEKLCQKAFPSSFFARDYLEVEIFGKTPA